MRTLGQEEFIDGLHDFIENEFPRREYLSLQGDPGTGKTYIVSTIKEEFPDLRVIYVAKTGKAVQNLQLRGLPCNTVASEFYNVAESQELKFILKPKEDLPDWDLVVIDEFSQVSQEEVNELISVGYRMLMVGDYNQLGVISGTQNNYLKNPDFRLTEVVRQAKDSGILRLAREFQLLERLPDYGKYSKDVLIIPRDKVTVDLIMTCSQAISCTNETRDIWNGRIRRAYNHRDYLPEKGEKLISVKNMKDVQVDGKSIINGTTGIVDSVKHTNNGFFLCGFIPDGCTRPVVLRVDENFFMNRPRRNMELGLAQMDWGYCLTVAKAQGSEWDNVLFLVDKNMPYEAWKHCVYTGITRAKKKLIIAYER